MIKQPSNSMNDKGRAAKALALAQELESYADYQHLQGNIPGAIIARIDAAKLRAFWAKQTKQQLLK